MLVYRRELVVDLLFDQFRGYHSGTLYYLPSQLVLAWEPKLSIVFLKPDILIKSREGKRESESTLDTWLRVLIEFLLVKLQQEVILHFIDWEQTLEAGVQIAEVGIVLEAYYPIGERSYVVHFLLLPLLFFNPLSEAKISIILREGRSD